MFKEKYIINFQLRNITLFSYRIKSNTILCLMNNIMIRCNYKKKKNVLFKSV